MATEIEAVIQSLLNSGKITQSDLDNAVKKYEQKSVVKADLNNLGDSLVTVMIDSDNLGNTVVDLLIKQAELEERIIALEGGTTNA